MQSCLRQTARYINGKEMPLKSPSSCMLGLAYYAYLSTSVQIFKIIESKNAPWPIYTPFLTAT